MLQSDRLEIPYSSFDEAVRDWRTRSVSSEDTTIKGVKDQGRIEEKSGPIPVSLFRGAKPQGLKTDRYTFFTPAAFHLYGGDAACISLMHRFVVDEDDQWCFGCEVFDEPILSGFTTIDGDNRWNHAMFALPRDKAPKFFHYVSTLQFGYGNDLTGPSMSVRIQKMEVPDPTLLRSDARPVYGSNGEVHRKSPKVEVYGLGVLRQSKGVNNPDKTNYEYAGYDVSRSRPTPLRAVNRELNQIQFTTVKIQFFDKKKGNK